MKSIRILLVDDEEPIRRGLCSILEDVFEGFVLAGQVENGAQALELIDKQSFDAVITDIRMPVMDGLELIRLIRVKFPTLNTIIMSGYDDYEYMRAAIQNGVTDYLLKPVDRQEFAQCMLRLREKIAKANGEKDAQPADDIPLLIRQICQIVDSRLEEDVSLQAIAEHMHYSYSYLSYLFKKEMGQSFSEYLTEGRLERARQLLAGSHMKIYEVAANCGYSDTNYFNNLFRRAEGVTPMQYRNALHGGTSGEK